MAYSINEDGRAKWVAARCTVRESQRECDWAGRRYASERAAEIAESVHQAWHRRKATKERS